MLLAFSVPLQAQNTDTNITDNKGLKQGYWQQFYTNGKLRYTGRFVDDKPVGIFQHYSDMGEHICTLNYYSGDTATGRYFHLNGKLKAEGKYHHKKRTGIWKFYNEYDEITSQEFYINDRRNGPFRIYYPDGRIARDGQFIDDLEHGPFKDFFPTGRLKSEGNYRDGNPDGIVTYYHPSGKLECSGFYRDAVRDSTWIFFDVKTGDIKRYDFYKMGNLKKSSTPEELLKIREEKRNNNLPPAKK